jgi:hypothetical protein
LRGGDEPVDLGPGRLEGITLVAVELRDGLLDLGLVLDHGRHHLLESGLLFLDTVRGCEESGKWEEQRVAKGLGQDRWTEEGKGVQTCR